jgi:hypothetical protein
LKELQSSEGCWRHRQRADIDVRKVFVGRVSVEDQIGSSTTEAQVQSCVSCQIQVPVASCFQWQFVVVGGHEQEKLHFSWSQRTEAVFLCFGNFFG